MRSQSDGGYRSEDAVWLAMGAEGRIRIDSRWYRKGDFRFRRYLLNVTCIATKIFLPVHLSEAGFSVYRHINIPQDHVRPFLNGLS
jgi:hypothetical protein